MLSLCVPRRAPLAAVGSVVQRSMMDPSTATVLAQLAKKAHIRYAIDSSKKTILTRDEFLTMCTNATTIEKERMSKIEASSFLTALAKAGVVLHQKGNVYLRPQEVFDRAFSHANLQAFNVEHPEEQHLREEATAQIDARLVSVREAMQKNAIWRRRFWASIALASGCQMLGLSWLTFCVLGWDTMEPICYFLTASTALASYLYFIWNSKDHTYASIDTELLFNATRNKDAATVLLESEGVTQLVQRVSIERAEEEVDAALVEELLKEARAKPNSW